MAGTILRPRRRKQSVGHPELSGRVLRVALNPIARDDEDDSVSWGELALDGLPELLARSRSSSWSERAAAAGELAVHPDPEAADALRELLRDPYDAAVADAARAALAARQRARALRT
jgi:HEAT repeat protein